MTTESARTSTSTVGKRARDFRMHALDLNPTLVRLTDEEQFHEVLAIKQAQADSHWLVQSDDYSSILRQLIHTVRSLQALFKHVDLRSDKVLALDLLKEMNLIDHPEPTGLWDKARFLVKFVIVYSRLYLNAKVIETHKTRELKKYATATPV